jgi:hypothetical protein
VAISHKLRVLFWSTRWIVPDDRTYAKVAEIEASPENQDDTALVTNLHHVHAFSSQAVVGD